MTTMLATELVNMIIDFGLTAGDLCAVSVSSRSFLGLHDENWKHCVCNVWGDLQLPPDMSSWRNASAHLHKWVRPTLRKSVAKAIRQLEADGYYGGQDRDVHDDTAKITSLRRFLDGGNIDMRRRVAAYVCSGKHKTSFIKCFLEDVDWLKTNKFVRFTESALAVECAFRYLLLKFPFLPIDAGVGADRVINAFTQVLLKNSTATFENMHVEEHHDRKSFDPDIVSAADNGGCRPKNLPCLIPEIPLEEQRDAVYILVYSLIMLNTDLHNPAINPKIKAEQFVRSCKQTVLCSIPESMLVQMYHHIRCDPLRISNRSTQIHTTVTSGEEEDYIVPACYSRYSSLLEDKDSFLHTHVLAWLPDMTFLFQATDSQFCRTLPLGLGIIFAVWSLGCTLIGAWASC
jgi:hypothetical protein